MVNITATYALVAVLALRTLAAPSHTLQDLGTFASPASRVRPRFRYWLPDASVDANIVIEDLQSAGRIGAGGVEFLPFYNYGGTLGVPAEIDWSFYGFGTDTYKELFKNVLRAIKAAGLVIDVSLGPNQGQGVPAETDNPGLQWDLVHVTTTIPANGFYGDVIPGWGTSANLLSINTAHVLSQINESATPEGVATALTSNWTVFLVRSGSFLDQTANFSAVDGRLELSLPAIPETEHYQLTAIYEVQTLQRACTPGRNPQNYLQNGSFVVDHFSKQGAQVVADFWNKHLLDHETKELLLAVGNYMWEDSIEIDSNVNWTPDLPLVFEQMHGYSIHKHLPLILWGNNNINIQSQQPGTDRFISDDSDQDQSFLNDYRETLATCYRRFIQGLSEWSHRELKMNLSLQVSYNLPMDALASVPAVDAPETETIQFGKGEIDSIKQFAGATFLAGKSVLSCEMGGEFGSGYRQTLAYLLFLLNRSFTGGVNQQVIHGQTYSGEYSNTTWPGLTPFNFIVADAWSQRQPCWDNGFADLLHYIGRISYTQQSGVPKFDLAFYQKDSITDPEFDIQYNQTDLIEAGYTYNYLSPENFFLPQAQVWDGILSPRGSSYKALVVQGSQNLTFTGAEKLMEYSQAGLPILFAGGVPGAYPENHNSQRVSIMDIVNSLLSHENVHQVPEGQIAQKLADIGITPNIAVYGSDSLYTTWREGGPDDIDWAFLYSDLKPSTAKITVASGKTAYIFDPWTGTRTALLGLEQTGGVTVIPVELAANQSLTLGFTTQELQGSPRPSFNIAKLPPNAVGYEISPDGNVILKFANASIPESFQVLTSTPLTCAMDVAEIRQPFEISDWTLTVEHWAPPANLTDFSSTYSVTSNTTHEVQAPLKPWTELPGLNETSGLGFYTSNFTWEAAADEGAYLYLDAIKHTARVILNGQSTMPLDLTNPILDIMPYLVSGKNEIMIVVSTTLWNAILPVLLDVYSLGRNLVAAGLFPTGSPLAEGLVGTVRIVPYRKIPIEG